MPEIFSLLAQAGVPSQTWLDRFNSNDLVAVVAMGVGLLVVVLSLGLTYFDKVHRRNKEAELKLEMLERGMSVDEIERVLAAKITSK